MTPLERTRALVAGKPVDRLPCHPMLMMFAARHHGMKYIDYTRDGRIMAEAQLHTARDFGTDVLLTCTDPAREVIDIAGEGSVDWFEDQGPAINEERAALSDKTLLRQFKLPEMGEGSRMFDRVKGIRIMHREAGGDLSIVGWVEGPLALAAELRGINSLMLDMIDDPDFVGDLLDFCAEVAIRYAMLQIDAGADTIGMSDAAASMMGPHFYHELLHPRQMRVYEAIKKAHPEVLTRSHMCGRTNELAEDMNLLPVDIFEVDFPSDLIQMKKGLGRHIISGNVSTITDIFEGTPEGVYAAAAKCHRICGDRHIVNAGCEIPPMAPAENVRALICYAREHRPEEVGSA